MQIKNNAAIGTPEKLTPAQLEALKAVIEMPGLTTERLRKEYVWQMTPSFLALDHRIKALERRGIIRRVTVTKIPTIYPTDIGKATLRSLRPVPMNKWCITCEKSGKRNIPVAFEKRFCPEHVELFAQIRQELKDSSKMIRKRYVCKAAGCPDPRPKDEDFCYRCREAAEDG